MINQHTLDKNRLRVLTCPCGKSNADGKFVPFKNEVNYGYCHSCAKVIAKNCAINAQDCAIVTQHKPYNVINDDIVTQSLRNYNENNYTDYLCSKYGSEKALKAIAKFNIGTSKHWKGATVFWQIDRSGKVRTGKIMLYDPENGKRIKEQTSKIAWVHKQSIISNIHPNFMLKQCLFGLHTMRNCAKSNNIGIVESESTAVEMSILYPHWQWLATGGSSNMRKDEISAIAQSNNVVLFPDAGKYELWKNKIEEIKPFANNVRVSSVLEKYYLLYPAELNNFDLRDIMK